MMFCIMVLGWLLWPLQEFINPTSIVVEDRNGALLGARIASDGQWRFPLIDTVPNHFVDAIVNFEDKRFRKHPGFDPIALGRAVLLDIKKRKIVSGGSTITMQLVRMYRNGKPRTIPEKIVELLYAVKITCRKSKNDQLRFYVSNAPFGGNVVGLEAASWRYYGRSPTQLSWAENATLAVLPNEPSLVYPGKNRDRLKAKRDRLLRILQRKGIIDTTSYLLALEEPLIGRPSPLPSDAPQLCDRITSDISNKLYQNKSTIQTGKIKTTIDRTLQQEVTSILLRRSKYLQANAIRNAAVLVLDIASGETRVYIGNNISTDSVQNGNMVDCVMGLRSTGSVLKPFLYAAMLDDGQILPTSLIPDIPTSIGGFTPQNFNRSYEGAVPAYRALARSLNIPAVRMVQQYDIRRFATLLKNSGMSTLTRNAEDYGISIILGGAEGTLWELTGMYASVARCVRAFADQTVIPEKYSTPFFAPVYYKSNNQKSIVDKQNRTRWKASETPLSAASCWCALKALEEVERPAEENAWREFAGSRRISWKTGTSFGFRDGWAIGCSPSYAVGVWVGNATGEGRPGLIGIETAGPILFDIFNMLPRETAVFQKPELTLYPIAVCHESGFRVGQYCDKTDTVLAPESGLQVRLCPYHQAVHLDKSGRFRVNSLCEQVNQMIHTSWFVLPPSMESYYQSKNAFYRHLPPMREDCVVRGENNPIGLMYPHADNAVYIPIGIDGVRGKAVLKAVHRDPSATLHWHIDSDYIGSTTRIHEMGVAPSAGNHLLIIIDNEGNQIEQRLEVIDKKD